MVRVDPKDIKKAGQMKKEPEEVPIDPIERREEYVRIVGKFPSSLRRFLNAYIHTGVIKEACEISGLSTTIVKNFEREGYDWRRAYALATVDEMMAARHVIEQNSVKAIQTLGDLLDHKDPKIKIQAAKELAKLMENSKVQKIQHEHIGEVNMNLNYRDTLARLVEGESRTEDVFDVDFTEVYDSENE